MLMANKPQPKRFKSFIVSFVLFCMIFISSSAAILSVTKSVHAGAIPGVPDTSITILDIPRILGKIAENVWKFVERGASILYKNALNYFLQRIAYDTATFLATGDKGQKPLYWDEGFLTYLNKVGGEAVGDALDGFSRDTFGVSLCEPPTAGIKLGLIISAKRQFEPRRAVCTFNDILKSKFINVTVNNRDVDLSNLSNEDFRTFANFFRPESNELGAAFILRTTIQTRKAKDEQLATIMRSLEPDIRSLTSPIGKLGEKIIKTPAVVLKETLGATIFNSLFSGQTTLTGDPWADAISTFTNTFASKFLKRLQQGLLVGGGGSTGGGPGDIGGYGSSGLNVRAAQAVYAEFIIPSFRGGGELDILGTLSSCPPSAQGRLYNNCILDRNLTTAIDQELTVREAAEQGYLDLNKPFGFLSDGTEPEYYNGYSYRSLVFLRKYRIIPVTWELAALYIRDINPTSTTHSLATIMGTPGNDFQVFDDISSPFYHLIDPNWVLKIPKFECRVQGPGPQIIETVNQTIEVPDPENPTGDFITQDIEIVVRADYCADEVSCIVENPNGTCLQKGYCTNERDIWRFAGDSCEPEQATCETYVSVDRVRSSYVASTLDNCDFNEVGCRWYSAYKNVDNAWSEDIWDEEAGILGSDGKITFGDIFNRSDLGSLSYARYFNNSVESCSSADDGCQKYLELTDFNPPDGYDDSTESIYQYIQSNPGDYADAGYYDSYGQWSRVQEKYLKQAPPHLNCPIDINDPDRDFECDNYAQSCSPEDVGCALYTPLNGDPPVPAVVQPNDYCSEQCVGYDQYLEQPTYFELQADPGATGIVKNLIPDSANSCRAQAVGCEEFTNLDEVAKGGEGIEYYTYLRECIAPNDPSAQVFYTWEGSDTTGYQLKTWRLQASGGGPVGDSCTPAPDNLACRIFIDINGSTYDRDINTVVFATEDCHPYRRQVDSSIVYGLESLSTSCRQAEAGCHEYRGNSGNVVTIVINNDFESGTSEGWYGGSNSNESVYVGGHSLDTNGNLVMKRVDSLIRQDKSYTLSFWAKSTSGSTLAWEIQAYEENFEVKADFLPDLIHSVQAQTILSTLHPVPGTEISFGSVSVGTEWQYYQVGSMYFDRIPYPYEFLQTNGADVYLDNIIMREITDSYYLIQDSWETPAVCNQPFEGAQLGCQAYNEQSGNRVNLLGFSSLCSDSVVGCKALIDTQNSDSPYAKDYNTDNNATVDPLGFDDITIPNDNLVYLVDDPEKYCSGGNVGCQLTGQAILNRQTDEMLAFNDMYVIDNPERYNQNLCSVDGLYCQEYQNERTRSSRYFIDPGSRLCEYRAATGSYELNWYRQGTDILCLPNKVCSNDLSISCDGDPINGDECAAGGGICIDSVPSQPIHGSSDFYDGWVGACSEAVAGCSQFVDPEAGKFCSNNQFVSCGSNVDCNGINDILGTVSNGVCRPHFTNQSYYYLEQSVDTASCNGLVDRERGCRLFNKTDGTPVAYTINAYPSIFTPDRTAPQPGSDPELNDSNIILKVGKDRVCSEWLYCRTRVEAYDEQGNRDDKCFDIGLCNGLNSQGECNSFPSVKKNASGLEIEIIGEQRDGASGYSPGRYIVEDLRTMSGFTKAGMEWVGYGISVNDTVPGYLPYSEMIQVGNSANILGNSSFEELVERTSSLESPFAGWASLSYSDCGGTNECIVSADTDSVSGQYSAHLSVSGGGTVLSHLQLRQYMTLPSSEYVLSGFIKWDNVTGTGSEYATLEVYEGSSFVKSLGTNGDYSDGWEKFALRFTNTNPDVHIRLTLWNVEEGDAYFDDLKIEPALQVTNEPDEILIGQSCRMYPESDSPSCTYKIGGQANDPNSGKIFVGWPGFCAESDPRNINYCVNWWPVDVIRGSMSQVSETPLAFSEKVPLYYCVEAAGNLSSPSNKVHGNATTQNTHSGYKYKVSGYNFFYWNNDCGDGEENDYSGLASCSDGNDEEPYYKFDGPYYDDWGRPYKICLNEGFAIGGCSRADGDRDRLISLHNSGACSPPSTIFGWPDPGGSCKLRARDLPETEFYDWEIEKIVLDKVSNRGYPEKVVLSNATRQNTTKGGAFEWAANCKFKNRSFDTPIDGICSGTNDDYFSFAVVFDNEGHPSKYYIQMDDYSGEDSEAAGWNITYYLRESCTAIVKVAEVTGNEINAVPYWSRVNSLSGYVVDSGGLNYSYNTDSEPFASAYQSGILGDDEDPATWDYTASEPGKQPLYILAENKLTINDGVPQSRTGPNIRGGSPYACQGDCAGSVCVGGPREGTLCDTLANIEACYYGDGSQSFGVCVGPSALNGNTAANGQFALWGIGTQAGITGTEPDARLRSLFARSFGAWEWDAVQNQYVKDLRPVVDPDALNWDDTGLGTAPEVGNVLVNDQVDNVVVTGGGGTIKLSFTSNINNNQLPLRSYEIDWGDKVDNSSNTIVNGYFDEKPSPGDPHVLYHTYEYDDSDATVVGCPDPIVQGANCKNHSISITVTDNWGRSETASFSIIIVAQQ